MTKGKKTIFDKFKKDKSPNVTTSTSQFYVETPDTPEGVDSVGSQGAASAHIDNRSAALKKGDHTYENVQIKKGEDTRTAIYDDVTNENTPVVDNHASALKKGDHTYENVQIKKGEDTGTAIYDDPWDIHIYDDVPNENIPVASVAHPTDGELHYANLDKKVLSQKNYENVVYMRKSPIADNVPTNTEYEEVDFNRTAALAAKDNEGGAGVQAVRETGGGRKIVGSIENPTYDKVEKPVFTNTVKQPPALKPKPTLKIKEQTEVTASKETIASSSKEVSGSGMTSLDKFRKNYDDHMKSEASSSSIDKTKEPTFNALEDIPMLENLENVLRMRKEKLEASFAAGEEDTNIISDVPDRAFDVDAGVDAGVDVGGLTEIEGDFLDL